MAIGLPELKAISVAARLGSLSRTAEALNITQPALSRRIAEAERSLEVQLFERLPRGVKPTAACLAFLEHAEIALTSIDDGREAAALAARSRIENRISIAFLEVFCDDLLIDACAAVADRFADASIDFRSTMWSAEVSAQIMSGASKLGLRFRKDSRPQVESTWIADDPVSVTCAATHPLAKAGRASLEQLEECQWVGSPAAIDRTFATHQDGIVAGGFQRWKTMDVHTIHARRRLMLAGRGLAILRRSCIEADLRSGAAVELKTPLIATLPIFLVWRRGAYLNDATRCLADLLKAAYAARRG